MVNFLHVLLWLFVQDQGSLVTLHHIFPSISAPSVEHYRQIHVGSHPCKKTWGQCGGYIFANPSLKTAPLQSDFLLPP